MCALWCVNVCVGHSLVSHMCMSRCPLSLAPCVWFFSRTYVNGLSVGYGRPVIDAEVMQRNKKSEGRDYDDADEDDREALRQSGQLAEDDEDEEDEEDDEEDDEEGADDDDDDGMAVTKVRVAADDDDEDMGSAKKDKKAAKKALAKAAQAQARAAAAAAEVEAAEAADPLLRLRNNLLSQFRKYLRDVTGDPTPDATWIEFLFHVPVQSKKMLLASTAEILAETVYVRATKGIDKCYLEPKDNPKTYVVFSPSVLF
jgi:hypothetical protein